MTDCVCRYTSSAFSECSLHCGGGVQTRSVYCINERTSAMVDESHCTAQGLRKPASQKACNEHPCAEYSVGPFGDVCCYLINIDTCSHTGVALLFLTLIVVLFSCFLQCSATCGEGQQTREVFCVGGRGEHIPEHHCRGLTRPHDVRSCQRSACHQVLRYYINDFSLVREERRGRA